MLSGYSGIIVTDGYAGYNNIEDTTHVECLAHARRYFYESIPSGNTNCSGYEACVQIDKLFEIEREISDLSNIVLFIKWVSNKFALGDSRRIIRDFEIENDICIDPVKQIANEQEDEEEM